MELSRGSMHSFILCFQTFCQCNPLKNKSNLTNTDKSDIITFAVENQGKKLEGIDWIATEFMIWLPDILTGTIRPNRG
jgi:hypothetical protein